MTAFGLGPMPGTSMALAADIVLGETGELPHLPELPARGLGSDAVGRTAGLLEDVWVDRGPRSWQMCPRPQIALRRTWDRMQRDLDEVQEVWGEQLDRVKVQVLGPWSLAASIELSDGHRMLTDRVACADLWDALRGGIDRHMREVARRFGCEVVLQLDEPLVGRVIAGAIGGAHQFETIRAVPEEVAAAALADFPGHLLNLVGDEPSWEIAAGADPVIVEASRMASARSFDGLGAHLDAGRRVGLAIPAGDARDAAVGIARLCDRVGLPRDILTEQVDVVPWPLGDAAAGYRFAAEVAGMLSRDAGDL